MALSKTQKIGIINKWISADDASLFQAVNRLCDENRATAAEEFYLQTKSGCYFCEDFDTLWNVVLRENNEEVKILRKKGTDDEEIAEQGYTLPEDLARLEQLEHVTIIQRTYTGGGIYIYRGRLADGRYFFGATDEEPEILKDGINPFEMDWDDLCYKERKGKSMLFSTIKKMAAYCKEYSAQVPAVRTRQYLLPPSAAYIPKYKEILENATHLLIGGTTGSGKSVILNGLLHTALALYGPADMSFILIDPKIVELSSYKKLPHTLRYETEPEEVLSLLRQVYGFMMDRYAEMDRTGEKKYNGTKLVIVIDELADLLMSSKGKEIKAELVKLLQKGRAANIMIIMATQSPSRKVLSAELVLNVPNRIALYCDNAIESKQIIGVKGAEELPWHGSCLYKFPGKDGLERLNNIPVIDDAEIKDRVLWWTRQAA